MKVRPQIPAAEGPVLVDSDEPNLQPTPAWAQ
jgi:hypothetical protein